MEESAKRSLAPMTLGMWIVCHQHLQWQWEIRKSQKKKRYYQRQGRPWVKILQSTIWMWDGGYFWLLKTCNQTFLYVPMHNHQGGRTSLLVLDCVLFTVHASWLEIWFSYLNVSTTLGSFWKDCRNSFPYLGTLNCLSSLVKNKSFSSMSWSLKDKIPNGNP